MNTVEHFEIIFDHNLMNSVSFGGGGGGSSSGGGGGCSSNTGSGKNGTSGWFDGVSGNEGNEGNENNEGNEGNEGNFWNDLGSGISNAWGNAKGGLHKAGGHIGDIGGVTPAMKLKMAA